MSLQVCSTLEKFPFLNGLLARPLQSDVNSVMHGSLHTRPWGAGGLTGCS